MLLAVDIGNTSTKFGIFDGEHLLSKFSIPTKRDSTPERIRSAIGQSLALPINAAIVCSVVPEAESSIGELVSSEFQIDAKFVRNDLDFGLNIRYEPLSAAGTDRIVNAFAATQKYGTPCIVCSFGTATTVDVVNAGNELLGGIIAPGMTTMAKELHLNTSKLPEVPIEKPAAVIANTTIDSIRSGIFYGQIGMIEGIIGKISEEIGGKATVVATGGFARMISDETGVIDIVDENLLLDGLNLLFKRLYTDAEQ